MRSSDMRDRRREIFSRSTDRAASYGVCLTRHLPWYNYRPSESDQLIMTKGTHRRNATLKSTVVHRLCSVQLRT